MRPQFLKPTPIIDNLIKAAYVIGSGFAVGAVMWLIIIVLMIM